MMTEDENDGNVADTSNKYPAWLRIMSASMTGSSQTSIASESADERKDADEEGASIAWANRQSPPQPDPAATRTLKGSQFQPTEEELEKLPVIQRLVLMLRFMYCGCAVLMGVAAVLHALSLTGVFLAAYALFFSCLLCCSSCPFPLAITRTRLIKYFGFLYSGPGRLVYVVLISMMLLAFGVLGYITIGLLVGTSATHIYLDWHYGALFRREFKS